MKAHFERIRSQLGDLGAMTAKTEAAERKILANAQKRLSEVNASIERARTGIDAAPDDAQKRYLDLVAERGQLNIVIDRSRQVLGLS